MDTCTGSRNAHLDLILDEWILVLMPEAHLLDLILDEWILVLMPEAYLWI
jgi:hypothetical protein